MSREEFMRQLEALLTDISEEKREALSYYRSYFEDAGEENEERILKELESPQKVAATIKADLGIEQNPGIGSYTEHGYEDQRFEQKHAVDLKKEAGQERQHGGYAYQGNQTAKILLIVVLALITSPIWGLADWDLRHNIRNCGRSCSDGSRALYQRRSSVWNWNR